MNPMLRTMTIRADGLDVNKLCAAIRLWRRAGIFDLTSEDGNILALKDVRRAPGQLIIVNFLGFNPE